MKALLLYCAVASLFVGIKALRCIPCNPERCRPRTECPYGKALDICNCCEICAKGKGEQCGGIWNLKGTCGDGFVCSKPKWTQEDQSPGVCLDKP